MYIPTSVLYTILDKCSIDTRMKLGYIRRLLHTTCFVPPPPETITDTHALFYYPATRSKQKVWGIYSKSLVDYRSDSIIFVHRPKPELVVKVKQRMFIQYAVWEPI